MFEANMDTFMGGNEDEAKDIMEVFPAQIYFQFLLLVTHQCVGHSVKTNKQTTQNAQQYESQLSDEKYNPTMVLAKEVMLQRRRVW